MRFFNEGPQLALGCLCQWLPHGLAPQQNWLSGLSMMDPGLRRGDGYFKNDRLNNRHPGEGRDPSFECPITFSRQ
jgi:hypothetical protein